MAYEVVEFPVWLAGAEVTVSSEAAYRERQAWRSHVASWALHRMFWLDIHMIESQWAICDGEWGTSIEEADAWTAERERVAPATRSMRCDFMHRTAIADLTRERDAARAEAARWQAETLAGDNARLRAALEHCRDNWGRSIPAFGNQFLARYCCAPNFASCTVTDEALAASPSDTLAALRELMAALEVSDAYVDGGGPAVVTRVLATPGWRGYEHHEASPFHIV